MKSKKLIRMLTLSVSLKVTKVIILSQIENISIPKKKPPMTVGFVQTDQGAFIQKN